MADSGSRQGVADEADGVDERRAEFLELLAQVADVGLHDVPVATEVVVPDVVEDLRLREDVTRIEHEVAEEVELGRREVDGVAVPAHLVGALVEFEIGEAEDPVVLGLVSGAAQDGMHPGDHLGQREGLRHVVVAADGEAGQLVLQGVARRQEEDRHPQPVRTQPPGDLESVEVGQHDVEDHEVRRILLGLRQGLAPGHRFVDREALVAQRRRHRIDDRGFVVDHQHPRSVVHRLHLAVPPWHTGSRHGFSVQCDRPVGPL